MASLHDAARLQDAVSDILPGKKPWGKEWKELFSQFFDSSNGREFLKEVQEKCDNKGWDDEVEDFGEELDDDGWGPVKPSSKGNPFGSLDDDVVVENSGPRVGGKGMINGGPRGPPVRGPPRGVVMGGPPKGVVAARPSTAPASSGQSNADRAVDVLRRISSRPFDDYDTAELFELFDGNQNGFIAKDEFRTLYDSLDKMGVDSEFDEIIAKYKLMDDNKLSYDEFALLIAKIVNW